jgi:hypothetical protein
VRRQQYNQNSLRLNYALTPCGRGFQSVVGAFFAFERRHLSEEMMGITLVDTETGLKAELAMIDKITGQQIGYPGLSLAPRSPGKRKHGTWPEISSRKAASRCPGSKTVAQASSCWE